MDTTIHRGIVRNRCGRTTLCFCMKSCVRIYANIIDSIVRNSVDLIMLDLTQGGSVFLIKSFSIISCIFPLLEVKKDSHFNAFNFSQPLTPYIRDGEKNGREKERGMLF